MIEYTLFRKLPFGSQINELEQKGTLLATRNHKDWSITLYSVHDYFVGRWERNGLDIIGTFYKNANAYTILEPYVDSLETPDFN